MLVLISSKEIVIVNLLTKNLNPLTRSDRAEGAEGPES